MLPKKFDLRFMQSAGAENWRESITAWASSNRKKYCAWCEAYFWEQRHRGAIEESRTPSDSEKNADIQNNVRHLKSRPVTSSALLHFGGNPCCLWRFSADKTHYRDVVGIWFVCTTTRSRRLFWFLWFCDAQRRCSRLTRIPKIEKICGFNGNRNEMSQHPLWAQ